VADTRIASVRGRRVWDSRGQPTVEVEVALVCGATGRAIAPAGASTGTAEVVELRDHGPAFGGHGVERAVAAVNGEIAAALKGADSSDQAAIDSIMIRLDGTDDRSRLGGNAIVASSMAVLHARAAADGVPLWRHLAGGNKVRMPLPEVQIFGGGAHAARRVDIQDFMVMCPAASTFSEALEWTAEIYRAAGLLMARAGKLQGVADEGGYWPVFASNEEALDTLVRSIEEAGFKAGKDACISLDIAASEFGGNGEYRLALDGKVLDTIHAPYVVTPTERGRLRKFLERLGTAWYGYGWRSYDYAGHHIIGHRGGINGYRSLILFDPDKKSGVVALWNSNTNQPGGLEFEVMDMIYHLPFRDWLELNAPAKLDTRTIAQADQEVENGDAGR